jgi:hypothetical protein
LNHQESNIAELIKTTMASANQLIAIANNNLQDIKNGLKTDEEKAIFAKEFVNSDVLKSLTKLQNEMKSFEHGNSTK